MCISYFESGYAIHVLVYMRCSLSSLQIEELLLAQYGSGFKFDPYIVVACMLVQEGADPHIKNLIGQSPLQKCPPDLASVVRMFAQGQGLVDVHELLVNCARHFHSHYTLSNSHAYTHACSYMYNVHTYACTCILQIVPSLPVDHACFEPIVPEHTCT